MAPQMGQQQLRVDSRRRRPASSEYRRQRRRRLAAGEYARVGEQRRRLRLTHLFSMIMRHAGDEIDFDMLI